MKVRYFKDVNLFKISIDDLHKWVSVKRFKELADKKLFDFVVKNSGKYVELHSN